MVDQPEPGLKRKVAMSDKNKTENQNNKNKSSLVTEGVGPKYMSNPDDARRRPKRFYKQADIAKKGDSFTITLDDRVLNSPMKAGLLIKSHELALAIAKEWQEQGEYLNTDTMIYTKLANTALDRVAPRRAIIIDEVISYAGTDLICYRAVEPLSLISKEEKSWDPILEWFKNSHNINLKTGAGIMHVAQDNGELQKLTAFYGRYDEFTLTAIHNMTTLLGSALLPLALLMGEWSADDIWRAAHIEEDFQIERWGGDEEAEQRRAKRRAEFDKTYSFYLLSSR